MLTSYNIILVCFILVPLPLLTITGPPKNGTLSRGVDVTLICAVALEEVVDTPASVQINFRKNGLDTVPSRNERRITISDTQMEVPPYQSTIRFDPVEVRDAGMYECTATVTPHNSNFTNGSSSSVSWNISVSGTST